MTQEELKLVLDALKWCHGGEPCGTAEAIAVVEKALANVATNDTSKERVDETQKQRHEQEPVATVEDNSQQWKGMDGAIAFHLIERHADGWNDIRKMMGEWLSANTTPPQPEQCKYPDCKCPTENPCLKGLTHEQEPSIQDRLNNALQSLDFYRRRIYALQEWHGKMRDPERTIVCDIIVNGHTLDPAGDRYTHSPQPKQEPVAWLPTDRNPLTVEELKIIWQNLDPCDIVCRGVIRALVRAVESAHGIKENT